MGEWIRRRLTFANVVSVIALFIALGGGAYAIQNHSVGRQDLQQQSVGFKKLTPRVHHLIRKGVLAESVADLGDPSGTGTNPCQFTNNGGCQNVAGEEHTPAPFIGGDYTITCPSGMVVAETTDSQGDPDPVWTIVTNSTDYSATGTFAGSRVDDGEFTAMSYAFDYVKFSSDHDHVQGYAACVPQ
jgi:hypothetical protein